MTITRVGEFGGGVDTGSLTLTLPTGISFGDAAGAVVEGSTSVTLTTPAGWSLRSGWPKDGGNARWWLFTKDSVTASDSGTTVAFAPSANTKLVGVGFVVHSGNGFPSDWTDALNFTAHTTTSASYTAPSSTSTASGDWGVAIFGSRGTGPFNDWTPASGLTERQDLTRSGGGATTLQLCDSNGSIGAASTVWGPFTESNLSTSNGGALTWLVKENATGGGGGGGGGGGAIYPKLGLWRDRTGVAWRTVMNQAEALYGPFQGHWGRYYGAGSLPIGADVEQAFRDGKDIHVFWKPWDVSWGDTAAGGYNTEIDAVAADVIALCSGTGRKLWLTLHHEPEDDYINNGSGGAGWTAQNYRDMWSTVRTRFNSAGASQYVTWVLVWQNSHSHPAEMLTLYGNDGVMDGLVEIVSQQDYIAAGTDPTRIATKWLEDLEFLVSNETANRKWSYLNKPQAVTEWGADHGGVVRGTNSHRAQTIDAVRGILPSLASRNVAEIRYFDARTNEIDDPPAVDGVAFQQLKDASEAGQQTAPVSVAGVALANDGITGTTTSIPFLLPSGWQQGDYALAFLVSNGTPSISTVPAGWALRDGPTDTGAANGRAWVYEKTLAAGEANPTWTISAAQRPSGVLLLVRGASSTAPVHAVAALQATSPGTSHAVPAVTTTATQAFILSCWLVRWSDASGNGGVNYGTAPGTHTADGSVSVNSGASAGSGGLVAHLTASPVAAGTYGPYTATFPVSSTGLVTQLALLPAGVAEARQFAEEATGTDTLQVDTGAVPKTLGDTGAGAESLSVVASGAPAVGFPTQKVEVAFASQPMAANPIFTDITPYVRWPIEREYGRRDEFSEVTPGTIRLRLANADGRFTMGKTGGAYYPNVKIGRRLRWSETFNGVNYVRFDGHVDAWPTVWTTDSTRDAEAQITATDRLKRLGGIGELRSMLEEEVLRDAPAAYYPLSEPDGATSAGSITATPQAAAVDWPHGSGGGVINFGQGTGPGTDGLPAAVFDPVTETSGRFLRANPVVVDSGSPGALTLEAWFNTESIVVNDARAMVALTTGPGDDALIMGLGIGGKVEAFYIADGQPVFGNLSPAAYNDGRTHHAAVTLARSGSTVTVRLYVDGVQRQTGTFTRGLLGTFGELDIGGFHVGGDTDWATFAGTLSHVAAYPSTLSAARILAHYQAGAQGLSGERTDQRIARVADWIAFPSGDRALDTGDKTMGPQATSGKQPLEVMREAERVEQGVLFVNGSGKLAFHRLGRRYNRTFPDLTLDGAAGQILVGLGFPGDDFGMVNDLEVTRPGGATQRARNQTSIDEYGLYRDSLEAPASSDSETQAIGNWRVGNYGEPRTRLPNLTVPLGRLKGSNPTLVAQLLAMEIGHLLRLTNLPSQAPASTLDVFVEGWTERADRRTGEWSLELNCSPADYYTVAQLGITATVTLGTMRVAL